MIALDVSPIPHTERSFAVPLDALVYVLECNYATLDDLEMKAKPVKSKVRRQRAICETGLRTLYMSPSEAYTSAKRARCLRVSELLKRPTDVVVAQTPDLARVDVYFGSTSVVAYVGSVSTGLGPYNTGWVARLYVDGSCVYVDNEANDSQAGRDRLARVLLMYLAVALLWMPDVTAAREAIARHTDD